MERVYATLSAEDVEYSKDSAAVPIGTLITQLKDAQADGATHVVGLSGNHRGAKYVCLGDVEFDED